MKTIEIIFIALALSIDSFAVSVASAATGQIKGGRAIFRLAFHLGFFQFMMPILGWLAGVTLQPLIAPFDHWIAFALLLLVAIRMFRPKSDALPGSNKNDPSRGMLLLMLATATSIDALAVGLSLAMLSITVWLPSLMIGVITSSMSLIGIFLGKRLQVRLGRTAEIIGGIILILIAIRIVVTHTIRA
jgi:putative Mn2+ efflux pump MntP